MVKHRVHVSGDVYDYLKGMVNDAAVENESPAEKITLSEAIQRLIDDREDPGRRKG